MGALHEGHASLIRLARRDVGGGPVVVSIFVNPLQFGVPEDLARYPRTLDADVALCRELGTDIVFAPSVAEVYLGGLPQVTVSPGPMADLLEGASRPGHFGGVLTVVAKLLGMVRPDVAVFGEKDFQQLTLVRRMVRDLDLRTTIAGAPTIREPDGLAMSSRNRLLSTGARESAAVLNRALRDAVSAAAQGRNPDQALQAAYDRLATTSDVNVDYVRITDDELGDLVEQPPPGTGGRILVAATVGGVRLIDNMAISFG